MHLLLTFVCALLPLEEFVLSDTIRYNVYFKDLPSSSAIIKATAAIVNGIQHNEILHFTISRNTSQDLMNEIVLQTKYRLVQVRSNDQRSSLNTPRLINLIFVDNYESFRQIYDSMTSATFNFQGLYLIIIVNSYENLLLDTTKIFEDMWERFIVNVNILVQCKDYNGAHLYTYFPYTQSSCAKANPVLWNTFENGNFKSKRTVFPSKLQNFFRCPLKVVTFNSPPLMEIRKKSNGKYHFGGVEGKLLNIIADRMNFDINLTLMAKDSLRWGNLFANGTSTGALKMVNYMKFVKNFGFQKYSMNNFR